jgi:hypothetical protein
MRAHSLNVQVFSRHGEQDQDGGLLRCTRHQPQCNVPPTCKPLLPQSQLLRRASQGGLNELLVGVRLRWPVAPQAAAVSTALIAHMILKPYAGAHRW